MKILQKAISNLTLNWTSTIPSMLIMSIVLIMFFGSLTIYEKSTAMLKNIQEKFSITIYLKDDADPFEVGNLITELEKRSDVKKPVTYTSKESAWKTISKEFSLDEKLLEKYKFSLPASITIMPHSPSDASSIEAFIESTSKNLIREQTSSSTKQKNITQQMIDFIQSIRESTLRSILLFVIFFIFGGTFLIASSVHLTIASRHREISIMKLMGARYSSIIAPFVAEGVLLGILAFVINLIAVTILFPNWIESKIYINALLIEFAAIIILNATASYLTTLFHIRKKHIF